MKPNTCKVRILLIKLYEPFPEWFEMVVCLKECTVLNMLKMHYERKSI